MYTFLELPARDTRQSMIFLIFVLLFACKEEPNQEPRKDGFTPVLTTREDSLYHDVMQGHDIGMAKMSSLRKHLTKVQKTLDSLNKVPGGSLNTTKNELQRLQEDLSYADQAMFTWMQEFNVDSAKSDKEKRIAYLESEKQKVEKVRDNILNSLRRADSLLGN